MEDNTGLIEFYYRPNMQDIAVSIQLSPDSTLPEVLEAFEGFLKAIGYKFSGEVNIVTIEEVPQDPQADLN